MIIILLFLFIQTFQKSDVYFTKEISSHKMIELLQKLNLNLQGNVGLKIHSGETNGKYFLRPDFLQEIYDYTSGTFIESNVAYSSRRSSSDRHKELLEENGWTKNNRRAVILDENPDEDMELPVKNPQKISKNYVGSNLKNFNSILVLSHFKGHSMGGFGGALKQLSIGFASQKGKTYIHTAGNYIDWHYAMSQRASQADFTTSMADAASTIIDYFPKGQIGYISVLANISSGCDCQGAYAPAPRINDIGILASTDPVAIDQACIDLIKSNEAEGTSDLLSQISRLEGENTLTVAENIGLGTKEYNLITIEGNNNNNNNTGSGNNNNGSDEDDEDDEDIPVVSRNNNQILREKNMMILCFFLFILLI